MPTTQSLAARLLIAERLVRDGQNAIIRQRNLIVYRQAIGRVTEGSEQLLAQFERSQVLFENDLARLQLERAVS